MKFSKICGMGVLALLLAGSLEASQSDWDRVSCEYNMQELGDLQLFKELGISVDEMTGEAGRRQGYELEKGVLLTAVEHGGAAWRAGLVPGVFISSVNKVRVNRVHDFVEVLRDAGDAESLLFLISDGLSSRFLVVPLD